METNEMSEYITSTIYAETITDDQRDAACQLDDKLECYI